MCATFPPGNTAAKWGTPSSAAIDPHRCLAIAGNDLDRNAGILQFGDRCRRVRPQTVLKTKIGQTAAVPVQARQIHPPTSARVGRVGKRPFRPAEPVGNRSRARLKSESGMLGDVVELDRRCGMTGGGSTRARE